MNRLFLLLFVGLSLADSPPLPPEVKSRAVIGTFSWNADPSVAGFRLYYGASSGGYTNVIDVGQTNCATASLQTGSYYFFSVLSYDASGLGIGFSDEVTWPALPAPRTNGLVIVQVEQSADMVTWAVATNFVLPFQPDKPQLFYRTGKLRIRLQ